MFHDPQEIALAKSLLREGQLTMRAVARQVGVPHGTFYKWFPSGNPDAFRNPNMTGPGKPPA